MKTNEMISVNSRIEEFKAALKRGVEGIVEAAGVYVRTIDESREEADKFRAAAGDFPSTTWRMFERIGRKQIHPMLVFGDSVDAGKARMIRRLPYSDQTSIFKGEHFPLITASGDTLMVSPVEATKEQTEQLIGETGTIRTPAEQKAWLVSRQVEKTKLPPPQPKPYRIQNGRVTFKAGTVLTRSEIKEILAEM